MKSLNFESMTQVIEFTHKTQNILYKKIHIVTNTTKGNVGMRFVGFGVGLSSSALNAMGIVGSLCECIIKGVGNLVLAAKDKKMSALFNGLKCTFAGVPLSVLAVVILPIHIVVGTSITTVGFLVSPKKYSNWRAESHSPNLEN